MRLAVEVPEFGSAYVDTVLKVYLTDLSASDRARSVIDRYDCTGAEVEKFASCVVVIRTVNSVAGDSACSRIILEV